LKIGRDESLAQLKKDNESQRRRKKEQIQSYRDNLKDFKQSAEQEIQAKKETLEQAKLSELQEKGADVELIRQAEQARNKNNEWLENARKCLTEYQEYKYWLKNEYTKLSRYQTEKQQHEMNYKKSTDELRTLTLSFNSKQSVQENQLNIKKEELQGIQEQTKVLDGLLAKRNDTVTKIEAQQDSQFDDYDAKKVDRWVNKYIEQNTSLNSKGSKGFNRVMKNLRSKLELYKLIEDQIEEKRLNDISYNDWIESLSALRWIVGSGSSLEQVIQSKINSFVIIGQQLQNLNTQLDRIEKTINSVGRSITKHLNESARQFEGINSLTANIHSIISKERFKKELVSICDLINRNQGKTVDASFIQSISNSLHTLNKDVSDIDLNKMIKVSIELEKPDGKIDVADNDAALEKISSEGMSFLILVMLFVSIKHSILQRKDIELLWSMDEVGRIHSDNVQLISDILKDENISFICAGPEISDKVANMFKHLYEIKWSDEHQSDMITKYQPERSAASEFDNA